MTVLDPLDLGAVEPGPRRLRRDNVALRGWLVGVAVYVTAVFHRSSLGVAGLDAAERYGISPGALSVFVLVQLGVYAAMQVPTGVLVDRYGPRRLLLIAAVTMAVAQVLFAVAPTYPSALAARTLLGVGDALTFISVLRYASQHFSARRFPVVVALTGTLGALGAVVATIPLTAALAAIGWTPSFAIAGVASMVAAAAVWKLMPPADPSPGRPTGELVASLRRIRTDVGAAWATSGTRAGFWVHFSAMSFTTMFGVLWGVPYLVAQGFSRGQASAVLTLCVATGIVASPVIGAALARYRAARVPFALAVVGVTVVGWSTLVFGFGGTPPHALLAVAVALTALGGPASGIGFAMARDYNPVALVGTASGLVNVGGFTASIVAAVGVGRTLDLLGADDASAFRIAFALAVAVPAFGGVQAVRWYLRLRASVLAAQVRGEEVPVPATRRPWDLAGYAAQS